MVPNIGKKSRVKKKNLSRHGVSLPLKKIFSQKKIFGLPSINIFFDEKNDGGEIIQK